MGTSFTLALRMLVIATPLLRSDGERRLAKRRKHATVNEQTATPSPNTRLLNDLRLLNRMLMRANRELLRSQRLLRETISEVREEVRLQQPLPDVSREDQHDA